MKTKDQELMQVELMIGRILAVGTYVSAALLVFGLVLTLRTTSDTFVATDLFSWTKTVYGLTHFVPDTYLLIGLLLLIFTPVLRVLITIFLFVKQKDHVYTAITVAVFLILVMSMVFGIHE